MFISREKRVRIEQLSKRLNDTGMNAFQISIRTDVSDHSIMHIMRGELRAYQNSTLERLSEWVTDMEHMKKWKIEN